MLRFEGHQSIQQRLILATLSNKHLRISDIRTDSETPGINETEGNFNSKIKANFIRFLEKITNGSVFEINYTGTSITYRPGSLLGGLIEHECSHMGPILEVSN